MNGSEGEGSRRDKADIASLSIKDSPTICAQCKRDLCLRKQVVNLALDNIEEMYCLECLGKMNKQSAKDILLTIQAYVIERECFFKEWSKYKNRNYCPEPTMCCINECFGESNGGQASI